MTDLSETDVNRSVSVPRKKKSGKKKKTQPTTKTDMVVKSAAASSNKKVPVEICHSKQETSNKTKKTVPKKSEAATSQPVTKLSKMTKDSLSKAPKNDVLVGAKKTAANKQTKKTDTTATATISPKQPTGNTKATSKSEKVCTPKQAGTAANATATQKSKKKVTQNSVKVSSNVSVTQSQPKKSKKSKQKKVVNKQTVVKQPAKTTHACTKYDTDGNTIENVTTQNHSGTTTNAISTQKSDKKVTKNTLKDSSSRSCMHSNPEETKSKETMKGALLNKQTTGTHQAKKQEIPTQTKAVNKKKNVKNTTTDNAETAQVQVKESLNVTDPSTLHQHDIYGASANKKMVSQSNGVKTKTSKIAKSQNSQKPKQELILAPSEIHYSQSSISSTFSDGGKIGELLDDIYFGRCFISALPQIQVAKVEGKWYAADNRRLWVMKHLECLDRVTSIRAKMTQKIYSGKMTSENGGTSVRIRNGDPGGKVYGVMMMVLAQENDTLDNSYVSEGESTCLYQDDAAASGEQGSFKECGSCDVTDAAECSDSDDPYYWHYDSDSDHDDDEVDEDDEGDGKIKAMYAEKADLKLESCEYITSTNNAEDQGDDGEEDDGDDDADDDDAGAANDDEENWAEDREENTISEFDTEYVTTDDSLEDVEVKEYSNLLDQWQTYLYEQCLENERALACKIQRLCDDILNHSISLNSRHLMQSNNLPKHEVGALENDNTMISRDRFVPQYDDSYCFDTSEFDHPRHIHQAAYGSPFERHDSASRLESHMTRGEFEHDTPLRHDRPTVVPVNRQRVNNYYSFDSSISETTHQPLVHQDFVSRVEVETAETGRPTDWTEIVFGSEPEVSSQHETKDNQKSAKRAKSSCIII